MTNPRRPSEPPLVDTFEDLVLDLLEWVGPNPRPYCDVIEAWRTSCPRLPRLGRRKRPRLISRHHQPGHGTLVSVTATGAEHLRKHREPSPR
jgi:hypothetical protein